MKKFVVFATALLLGVINAEAEDIFEVENEDGVILYYIDVTTEEWKREVAVISNGFRYTGELTIPDYIAVPDYKDEDRYVRAEVVEIWDYAFDHNENLTRVNLPKGLKRIDHAAFQMCTSLDSLYIPDGVREIQDEAFQYCIGLKHARIGSSFIEGNAFYWCTALEEVVFSAYVNEVHGVFNDCKNIKHVIFEDGPGEIMFSKSSDKRAAFADSKLDSVYVGKAYDFDIRPFAGSYRAVLGQQVTAIPPYLFAGQNVGELSIPITVTRIGKHAFENSSITQIHLTSTIQNIGEYAFNGCKNLTEVDLSVCPPTIVLERNALSGCPNLHKITLNDEMTEIPNSFLSGCSSLTDIIIPTSVTKIGDTAFSGCSSLKTVDLPMSLQYLGYEAFRNSGLEEIEIPETITRLTSRTFANCNNLRKVVLPNTCLNLGMENFAGCQKLEEINIPEGITTLGSRLFSGCSSLQKLYLPSTITSLEDDVFISCTNLKPIFQADNVIHVGDSAFAYCSAMENINGKLYIDGSCAFKGCTNLKDVELWGGDCLDGAFIDCSSLTSIQIPNNVRKVINRCFAGCTKLKNVVFNGGPNLCTLGNGLSDIFENCPIDTFTAGCPLKINRANSQPLFFNREMHKVSLLGHMKEIPKSFSNKCSIKTLLLGDSISFIDGRSFSSTSIDSIYCYSMQPPAFPKVSTSSGSNYNMSDSARLAKIFFEKYVKVSSGSGSLYRNAAYWKKNLIIDESDSIRTVDVKYPGTLIASMKQQGITEPMTTPKLKIIGTLNQSDWNVIKNDLTLISYLDISQVVGDTIPPNIFSNHFRLVDLVLPSSTTRIGVNAFNGCKFLKGNLSLPNCEMIGKNAFQGTSLHRIYCENAHIKEGAFKDCLYLTHADIQGVECQIDSAAFYNCSMLSILNMPTAKKIGSYAFYNCQKLDEISIDGEGCLIGDYAFAESGIKCASLGEGIKSIGRYAFSNCNSLESLVLPSNLSRLSEGMFANCVKLRKFEFPSSIQEIGSSAFSGCSIDSLNIPIQVFCMDGALKNCNVRQLRIHWQVPLSVSGDTFTGLNEDECTLYVPANSAVNYLTNDSWKVFWKIEEMESEIVHKLSFDDIIVKNICLNNWDINGDNELGEDEVLRIRDLGNIFANSNITSFDELQYFNGLRQLSAGIFNNCENLKRITIPKSIEELESKTFYGCNSLESIKVHPSNPYYDSRGNCNAIVRTEDNTLIRGCKNTIIIPTITSIADYAFHSVGLINRIDIPSHFVSIGEYAFEGCIIDTMSINSSTCLKDMYARHIIIGDNITMIPEYSFSGNINLVSIQFPTSLKEIQTGAFYLCSNLETITLPEHITSIAPKTFSGCEKICSISIPETVTSIGENAFGRCYLLKQIDLPSSLKNIETSTFAGSGLTSVTLPDALINIGSSAFRECDSLTSVAFPNGITSINSYAFADCPNLSSVAFPEGFTSIGSYAFSNSGLKTVHIPSSVTEISTGAFGECTSLKDVYVNWDDPATGYLGFTKMDDYKKINLHVPSGKKSVYQQDNKWKNCLHIWEPVIMGDINDDGVINVSDMMGLIYYILDYTTYYTLLVADLRYDAADINNDGKYRVDDLTDLLTMILDEEPANKVKPYMANAMQTEDKVLVDSMFNVSMYDNSIEMSFVNDSSAYSGIQFDVYLPNGYTISEIDLNQNVLSHEVSWKQRSDGSFRVIVYSMRNANLSKEGLKILYENQDTGQDFEVDGCIKNITLSTNEATSHYVSDIFISFNANLSDITSTSSVESNNIYIYDLNGKVVARFSSMDKITNLPKGVYIVNGRKYINR